MMDTVGIIMTGDNDARLAELTRVRSVAALPVAGRYRLIDFTLSGMVNSGIVNVGVTTRSNYRSLMDHLGSGKEWDLNRKLYGLRILPPYIRGEEHYSGDMDILRGIREFLAHSKQKYVLIAHGDLLFNPRFEDLQRQHISSGADITVMYNNSLCSSDGVRIELDGCRVTDMEVHPERAEVCSNLLGIYFMEKELLCSQIAHCSGRGLHDFVMDVLVRNIDKMNICGYEYKGFAGRIDSVNAYYRNNMMMLNADVRRELFLSKNFIYTKVKDTVPTYYSSAARVSDSVVADGCRIEGVVENSIIFRGVQIGRGAYIRNSIVMQNSVIEQDAGLDYAVLDKSVTVRKGKRISGQDSFPVIVGKNVTV